MAQALTAPTVGDAMPGVELIEAVDDDMASVTADAAYDTLAFYDKAGAHGATVVVPPNKTARVSRRRPRSSARDRTIKKVKHLGRRQWSRGVIGDGCVVVNRAAAEFQQRTGHPLTMKHQTLRIAAACCFVFVASMQVHAGRRGRRRGLRIHRFIRLMTENGFT